MVTGFLMGQIYFAVYISKNEKNTFSMADPMYRFKASGIYSFFQMSIWIFSHQIYYIHQQ